MQGRLFDNIVAFGRLLRGAGLSVDSVQLQQSLQAIQLAGVRKREDFYWALCSVLVTRPEHKPVFDQAFELFWSAQLRTRAVAELSLWRRDESSESKGEGAAPLHLLQDALASHESVNDGDTDADQRNSVSATQRLVDKHFDAMTAEELAAAKLRLNQLDVASAPYRTRRRERDARGEAIDWRRSLRAVPRNNALQLAYCRRRVEIPTLVLLCDISGSMQIYSRVLLHFVCALARRRRRTHAFLFGTRLTNVSRFLGAADIDSAVKRIAGATRDFDGGTRIGSALAEFNKHWSRRLLSRHSIVILLSDGLDADDGSVLQSEIDRLHRSCGHLMWLNPLLRFTGFEPKASGVRTILRHVDSLHRVHSLRHVGDVAASLACGVTPRGAVGGFSAGAT